MAGSVTASVLVIGGGPAGMVTVASLRGRGVRVRHVDRDGCTGGAYGRMDGDITLTSPARFIGLPGVPLIPTSEYITASEYRAYLECYANAHELAPETGTVERIEPLESASLRAGSPGVSPGYRVLETNPSSDQHWRDYRAVVVATGMFDFPWWPTIPGLEAPGTSRAPAATTRSRPRVMHAAAWAGAHELLGQRVLIIGGASSAIELAEKCAAELTGHSLPIVVSTRSGRVNMHPQKIAEVDIGGRLYPILHRTPRWLTRRIAERAFTAPGVDISFSQARRRGLIDVRSRVSRFERATAVFERGPRATFDVVILATGYRYTTAFLPHDVTRTATGHPRCDRGHSVSHPGLWFVGIPNAYQPTSQYLYGMARDGPRVAAQIHALTAD